MTKLALSILTLPDGRYVLQRRPKDTKFSPGLLGLFGGHVEEGEEPDDAVKRELTEETSLKISELSIQPLGDYELPKAGVHVFLYSAALNDPEFDVYEGEGAEVYTLSQLRERNDTADILLPLLEASL